MKNRVVWKYWVDRRKIEILIPEGAQLLDVGMQATAEGYQPCVWALVDPTAKPVPRTFVVVPTGAKFELNQARLTPVGAARLASDAHVSGEVVEHVFELTEA